MFLLGFFEISLTLGNIHNGGNISLEFIEVFHSKGMYFYAFFLKVFSTLRFTLKYTERKYL